MLKLGEKGAILQRDKQTYAIAPHIPCGLVTPDLLRKIADVAERYEVETIKITGATRFALVGLKEQDIDNAWQDLGVDKGAAVGLCVRSIRTCPGIQYCRLAKQDALAMGLKLDEIYHGMVLPITGTTGKKANASGKWSPVPVWSLLKRYFSYLVTLSIASRLRHSNTATTAGRVPPHAEATLH
jgi:NAD(P)H-nitrite reductase large subunit